MSMARSPSLPSMIGNSISLPSNFRITVLPMSSLLSRLIGSGALGAPLIQGIIIFLRGEVERRLGCIH